ncbi:MAG: hypothetical protein BWY82_02516 [Verrucomicrobia bacterium ADurb.Bin474]|nr:MAG: hypothetical protein BWY82_02516 [Verrucomicrobia bacterium ADurb.Bin474]
MRWNIGCHADCDAGRAVNEHIWDRRRQHFRFLQRAIKIIKVINRVHVQLAQDLDRGGRKPCLRVAHRRRRIAIHAAKVPLPVYQKITF